MDLDANESDAPIRPKFELPFLVITLEGLNQRAYQVEGGMPEWLWSRMHAFLEIASAPGKILRANKHSIHRDLHFCQVEEEEFHYRTLDDQQQTLWKDHTLGSRAFLVMSLWVQKNRGLKNYNKVKALELVRDLVQRVVQFKAEQQGGEVTLSLTMTDGQGTLHDVALHFNRNGITQQFGKILTLLPAMENLWSTLRKTMWNGVSSGSSGDAASLQDMWFAAAYIFCHPNLVVKGINMLGGVGSTLLPCLVNQLGSYLDDYAQHLAQQDLKALPVLRNKTGQARRGLDPVNRMILFRKMQREKLHRLNVSSTHDELIAERTKLMTQEAYITCALYEKKLSHVLRGFNQLSVCWDPSSYGGKETLVSIVYVPQVDVAAYLCNQQISAMMKSDVEEEIFKMLGALPGKAKKLEKVEGYNELRALSHALHTLDLDLESFAPPHGLLWQPLRQGDIRFKKEDGKMYISSEVAEAVRPVVPAELDLKSIPVLVSISDQGPNNLAALNYVQFGPHALNITCQFDVYHRTWNDVKLSCKRSLCGAWRVILELTLLFNLNYGPFGSGSWYYKKKALLTEFVQTSSIESALWRKFCPYIAMERRMQEPDTEVDMEALLASMTKLENFTSKGPLVKLMRWFSFFETCVCWQGEFWASKMVFESASSQPDKDEEGQDSPIEDNAEASKDPQKELQALKRKAGTWALAPRMINEKSMAVKDVLMSVCKASWKMHAWRARELKTPKQLLAYHVGCASTKNWADELVETIKYSLWEEESIMHLFPEWLIHEDSLLWHMDLFVHLMNQRAQSLTTMYLLPPQRYNHVLSPDLGVSLAAHKQALKEWSILLEAEFAVAAGEDCAPLQQIFWAKSPFARTLYIAHEEDERLGWSMGGAASALQKIVAQSLGDSRVVENSHQTAKDVLRTSRTKKFANTSIMHQTLLSGALQERKVTSVQINAAEKILQSGGAASIPIRKKLTAAGHKLSTKMQQVMLPQLGSHKWPSPSPASMFKAVLASHCLWENWHKFTLEEMASTWLSCLPQPGWILAQGSTGCEVYVVASGEFAFLGWMLTAVATPEGHTSWTLRPNKSDLAFFHVIDLQDWAVIPCEPSLSKGRRGPIAWKRIGDGRPLHFEICVQGVSLPQGQLVQLLRHLGVPCRKNESKDSLQLKLIHATLPEELRGLSLEAFQLNYAEEVLDSDLENVIEELGQDDANLQDIQDIKKKIKQKRAKKKIGLADKPLQPKRKAKGKGKRKGKGKGAAKGKGKGGKGKRRASTFAGRHGKKVRVEQEQVEAKDKELQEILAEAGVGLGLEEAMPQMEVEPPNLPEQPPKTPPSVDLFEDLASQLPEPAAAPASPPPGLASSSAAPPNANPAAAPAPTSPPPEAASSSAAPPEANPAGPPPGPASAAPGPEVPPKANPAGPPPGPASPSAAPAPAAPPKAKAAHPAPREMTGFRSPEEILSQLWPPKCKIGLSQFDHRFYSTYGLDNPKLSDEYKKKSYSCTFVTLRTWQQALIEVHRFNWSKWNLVKDDLPLPAGKEAQEPGVVPQEIFDALEPTIKRLPPVKRYYARG
eukprot:symbB.v1.2.031433.t1/scaffold3648.1/size52728/2